MTDLPFPLSGSTLLVGPSQSGKTRMTARALDTWIEREGAEDVVVLDFAPAVERDGTVLGGRLDRFTTIPDAVWHGVLDAHAPRSEGETIEESMDLARENAERADRILRSVPSDPMAVFVNDATIPLQHEAGEPERFTAYCDRAACAVVNAFESDELGTDDPISRREREVLAVLRRWADETVRLEA